MTRPVTPYAVLKEPKKPAPKGRERFAALKDPELRAYVASWPCVVCTSATKHQPTGICGPTQVAHVKSKGAAGGDWDNLVPLGRPHHAEQHRIGIRSFEYKYGLRLKTIARQVTAAYLKVHRGTL